MYILDIEKKSYKPVAMTPILQPGVDLSPLMTWGNILATPLPLSPLRPDDNIIDKHVLTSSSHDDDNYDIESHENPINRFKINQSSAREELARNLDRKNHLKVLQNSSTPLILVDTPLTIASSRRQRNVSDSASVTSSIRSSNPSNKSSIHAMRNKLTPAGLALANKLYGSQKTSMMK